MGANLQTLVQTAVAAETSLSLIAPPTVTAKATVTVVTTTTTKKKTTTTTTRKKGSGTTVKGATNKVTVKCAVKYGSEADCKKVVADTTAQTAFKKKFCDLMGSKNHALCTVTQKCRTSRRLMGERKLAGDGTADVTGEVTGLTATEATAMSTNADVKDTAKIAKAVGDSMAASTALNNIAKPAAADITGITVAKADTATTNVNGAAAMSATLMMVVVGAFHWF